MPVVSKGEFTVSRLDDGVSSHLHVGWLMADGTFTTVYPRENLQTGSNTEFILKNEAGGGSQKSLPFSILSDDIIGKKVILSVEVEGRNMTNRTGTSRIGYELSTPLTDGKTTWLSVWEIINNISNLSAKRIESAIDVPTNLTPNRLLNGKLYIQVNGEYIRAAYPKFEVVEDDGTKSTIYTPAPSEDYANAYPKYRGEYTDTIEADSTDPNHYTWTAYLGEQGPPTGVISQSTVPSSPYVGMLWQCTGNIAGYINPATYRWNGSAWEIYQFTAQNILAETFTGFTFQGVEFIGSVFLNVFDITYDDGSRTTGRTEIKDGTIDMRSSSFDSDGNTTESTVITLSPVMGVSFSNSSFYSGGVKYSSEARFITGGILLSDSTDPIDRDAILTSNTVNLLMTQGWLLWQGTWLCGSGTAYPDLPLTECFNGWALVFSEYANGAASNSGFNIVYISKQYVQAHNGEGTVIPITTYGEIATSKYLYFTNTEIRSNSKNSAGNSGKYVLREVYAW